MKNVHYYSRLFTIFLITVYVSIFQVNAQAPQKMSYQSVIRNASGSLVSNGSVGIKISILQGSASGTVAYAETHTTTTNVNGLATIEIGGGSLLTDSFSHINWANGPFYIKTETDPLGGTSYTLTGTSQLLSMPYALFANNGLRPGNNAGDMLYWNGTQWITVSGGTQGQTLSFCNGVPTWGPCAGVATLSTNSVSIVSAYSAYVNGTTTYDGGSSITARGICYSTSANPTIANNIVAVNGGGIGLYNCLLSGLTPGTLYYARAYATNSSGTAYGNQVSFTTPSSTLATLTTTVSASFISHTTARSGVIITNTGGSPITVMGICYATIPNPTIANLTTTTQPVNQTSAGYDLTNLTPNTTYYVRAYATNTVGTAYGNQVTFTTPNTNSIAVLEYPDTILSGSYSITFNSKSYLYPTKIVYPNLKKVINSGVPNSTNDISFSNCNNIVEVSFPVLDTLMGRFSFSNNSSLAIINAPSLKTVKGYISVKNNTSLQQLNICNLSNIYCDNGQSYYSISGNTSQVDTNLTCYAAALAGVGAPTMNPITQFSNNAAFATGSATQLCSSSYTIGICWGTTPNPIVNGSNPSSTALGSTSLFSVNMAGLTPNTTYYVRSYLKPTGSGPVLYSTEVSFITQP